MDNIEYCPCGTNKTFEHCCKPYITGNAIALNPEVLMRSRYSAYATKEYAYIVNTYAVNNVAAHAGSTNKVNDNLKLNTLEVNDTTIENKQGSISIADIESASKDTVWCKLEVLSTFDFDDKGEVEFIAYYKLGGEFFAMHELSRFRKTVGIWFYEDGDMLHKSGLLKPGRNDSCLCGSGKKFKRCCQD